MSACLIANRPLNCSHVEDLTRRELMAGAMVAALLIACGGDQDDRAPSASTRTITNKYGTYEIPTDPQRIVLMENRVELEAVATLA